MSVGRQLVPRRQAGVRTRRGRVGAALSGLSGRRPAPPGERRSGRPRIRRAFILLSALAAAILAWLGTAAPALARVGAPLPGNPPPGSGSFSHSVMSRVRVAGDVRPGAVYQNNDVPAQCWLEPRFTNAESYRAGDPHGYNDFSFDADTYWWSFASNEQDPLLTLADLRYSGQEVNRRFQGYQRSRTAGWWWAPAWLNDPQGLACAEGLVGSADLNNGYLDFAPAQTGGAGTPGHTIDGRILSELARAALALPSISLHTNPPAGSVSDVNLPVWVWVTYNAPVRPSDTATVPLPGGGSLWARVTTSRPVVSISVSDPGRARVYDDCGSTGNRYTAARVAAVPSCGVTFLAPSAGGPYTLTATVRWRVTWSDSTGASGAFRSPPYPPSTTSASVTVSVREIQSINGGG